MDKKIVRIICLILCAVMLLGLIPAIAFAAEVEEPAVQPRTITDAGDMCYNITSFEDLKVLAAGTYTSWVGVWLLTAEPLVISEDLKLPENMALYVSNYAEQEIIVPEGVTFEINSECYVCNLTVNGTMIANGDISVDLSLTVNGSLINNSMLRPGGECVVTGIENVTNGDWASIMWVRSFENADGMMAYIADAAARPDEYYEIYADYGADPFEVHISEDLTIPDNVWLHGESNFSITVDEGATLTNKGSLSMYGWPLVVNGTLNNENDLSLVWFCDYEYHYGSLIVNGTYTGDGYIYISAGERTDYKEFISGLDLSQFEIYAEEYGGVADSWTLWPKDAGGDEDPDENEMPFDDMDSTAYYVEPVIWAVDSGITTGLSPTEFGVDANCTRGQFVTFLWRAAGCPEPISAENNFEDVDGGQFYSKAVLWAVENGITNGLSTTEFGVNVPCSRSQVVTFLWRAAGSPVPSITDHTFDDVLDDQFYSTAILWAVENGITTGLSADTFGVEVPCNRAQVVTFLFRALA
ncbi:MAG: S-layer homology domain-containing protein [Oscillospiraceae bacterium]|nr:S-layer homology domain-containing protein [Oscillospiraceae bacterium]